MKELNSSELTASLISEIESDFNYACSNSSSISCKQVFDKYINGSVLRFTAIASFLYYNDFIETYDYRAIKDPNYNIEKTIQSIL